MLKPKVPKDWIREVLVPKLPAGFECMVPKAPNSAPGAQGAGHPAHPQGAHPILALSL